MAAPLLLLSALAVAAPANPRPPAGKLFRIRLPFEPATLDWNLGDVPIPVIQNAMRGLYRVDETGKVVPDLVADATVKDEGRTWIFHLKPGVRWSDGVPLSASHVTESFRRLLHPSTASTYAYFLFDLEGAYGFHEGKADLLGLKVLTELSFELRLAHETPYLPAILTHWVTYPIRPDLIARYKDKWTEPPNLETLGPYQIKEWSRQTRIVMTRNPHAEPKPWFERIEAWVIADDNTALNLYDTGHLELMTDPGQAAGKRPELFHRPSPISYFVGIGPGHPLTQSRAGILALSAALDRTEIPKALGAPHRPTLDLCPPEIWSALGPAPVDSYLDTIPLEGAPALARSLLKDAGFPPGKAVPPLKLRYFNRPAIKELAEWLQAQWKQKLGLAVTLEGQDPKSYWADLTANPAPLFLNSKGAAYPDPDAYFRLFADRNPQNLGRWSDEDYDKWMDEAQRKGAAAERRGLYVQASRRLLVEKPGILPLYFRHTGYLVKPYVKGLVINPLTSVDLTSASY
jgi:oligopeptide transport system substrate-binding protein